jgi:hypothetical protein
MFCDLVVSTALSAQLDPEELREIVRAYQGTCSKVIASMRATSRSISRMGYWFISAIPPPMMMTRHAAAHISTREENTLMATAYDLITDRILEKLQHGTVLRQKPWNSAAGLPLNLLSQKPYRGINVWVLDAAGYASPYWLTFKQAREIGGYVRKGEQGSPVVFWKWLEKDEGKQDRVKTGTASRRIPLARLYSVFNVHQCELPARLPPFLAILRKKPRFFSSRHST